MIIFNHQPASSGTGTLSSTFVPYKISIMHNTATMNRSGSGDGSRMPMASLLVIAHCNWKLLLSGFVCSGNYNKLSA